MRRGDAQVVLQGEARREGHALRVRFEAGPGLNGALAGVVGPAAGAVYEIAGACLRGRVEAPGTSGGPAVTRELACRVAPRPAAQLDGRLRVVDQALRDPQGRQALLSGVNVGLKEPPFLPAYSPEAMRRLAARTGIDFVRLYLSWCAVEPRPLEYDRAYLDAVAAQVRAWNEAGVYVLVDFHQDLWGPPLAEHGAPAWASFGLAEAAPRLLPADLPWQLRYVDRRCWASFEAFWSDRAVPASGLGLQEHYARAWQQVAGRLAGLPMVLGYDPMNEPFMGREIQRGLVALVLGSGWTILRSGVESGVQALLRRRDFQEELTTRLVRRLSPPDRFERVVGRLAGANRRFERRLSAFYARVGAALREVDPDRPLFVEPMPLAGVGVPSEMPHPGLDQLVYAPHLYDAFMDSRTPFDGDVRRVERAFARHLANARRLNAPLVIGEWGNLAPGSEGFAAAVGALFDRAGAGSAYWAHVPGREEEPLFLSAFRPGPRRVAGTLRAVEWTAPTRTLEVRWEADPAVTAPTVIALPEGTWPEGVRVELDGPAEAELQGLRLLVWGRGPGEVRARLRPAEPR